MALLHATCVAIDKAGVLIQGPSGSGKSDLAVRLMETGADLVGDDYVEAVNREGALLVSAPKKIAGKIELRGIGLCDVPYIEEARIYLVVELVPRKDVPRLPETETVDIEGIPLPLCKLHAFDASTPAKIKLQAHQLRG